MIKFVYEDTDCDPHELKSILSPNGKYLKMGNIVYDLSKMDMYLNNDKAFYGIFTIDRIQFNYAHFNQDNTLEILSDNSHEYIQMNIIDFTNKNDEIIKLIWENIRNYINSDDIINIIMECLGMKRISILRQYIDNLSQYICIGNIKDNNNKNHSVFLKLHPSGKVFCQQTLRIPFY